jgi:hypothetical protein
VLHFLGVLASARSVFSVVRFYRQAIFQLEFFLWGNLVNAITNFINPGSAIVKSLIMYVPLDHKINLVNAIHVIITI